MFIGGQFINLAGKCFGRLTAIRRKRVKNQTYYFCKCSCGNKKWILHSNLQGGTSKSCGCLRIELTIKKNIDNNPSVLIHGMIKTRFYIIWTNMLARSYYVSSKSFKNYGNRGIKTCRRWVKFTNFKKDMYKSYLKHVESFGEKQTTLDRINNNGNYISSNCRWATRKQQGNNTRRNILLSFNNKSQTLAQWAEQLKINKGTLHSRINKLGWRIEKAFNHPVGSMYKNRFL